MLWLDAVTRFSALALVLALCAILARDASTSLRARLIVAMMISLSGVLLSTAPAALGTPEAVYWVGTFIAIPNIGLTWWAGRALFEDDFRIGRLEWLGMTLAMLSVGSWRIEALGWDIPYDGLRVWSGNALAFGFGGHVLYSALAGRRGDLVETRRRLRLLFAVFILGIGAVTLILEGFNLDEVAPGSLFRPILGAAAAFWALVAAAGLRAEGLLAAPRRARPAPPDDLRPAERVLLQRLQAAMTDDRAWLEPGLTIAGLADRLGAPEHQLRALINKRLGWRNFPSYLNSFRIEAVKLRLAALEEAAVPVTTIALEAGFSSLSAFNRAFRAQEGMSPGEYRRDQLGGLT